MTALVKPLINVFSVFSWAQIREGPRKLCLVWIEIVIKLSRLLYLFLSSNIWARRIARLDSKDARRASLLHHRWWILWCITFNITGFINLCLKAFEIAHQIHVGQRESFYSVDYLCVKGNIARCNDGRFDVQVDDEEKINRGQSGSTKTVFVLYFAGIVCLYDNNHRPLFIPYLFTKLDGKVTQKQ